MAPPPGACHLHCGRRGADVAHRGASHAHSCTSADGAGPGPSRAGDARSYHHPSRPRCPRQADTSSGAGQAATRGRARLRAASSCHAATCHSPAGHATACHSPAGDGASSRDAPTRDAAAGPGARSFATSSGDPARGLCARHHTSGRGPVQEQEQAQEEEAERQEEDARPCSGAAQPACASSAGAHYSGGRVRPRTLRQRSERQQPAVRAMGDRPADRHGWDFAITSVVKVKR